MPRLLAMGQAEVESDEMGAWLQAFLFTQIVEVPIYMRSMRCSVWDAFGASAITHPIAWFGFFHPAFPGSYTTKIVVAELFAWLVEVSADRG